MSFLKNWKLILAALTVALFTACAGSSGGGSDEGGYEEGGAGGGGKAAVQKEKVDENKLKKNEDEAMALTEENHKLRKEIFDAKNKLGIPVERPDAE
jgi:hypothetical protein